jgi:hypothetical protein
MWFLDHVDAVLEAALPSYQAQNLQVLNQLSDAREGA